MEPHHPDYTRIVAAARNRTAPAPPLYEHAISKMVTGVIMNLDLSCMLAGDERDKEEAFRRESHYLASIGYDVYPFEGCITELVQGGQALMGRAGALIHDHTELEDYPWETLPDRYFDRFDPYFRALSRALPPGMLAVAGVGNGVFEIAQDFVPLTELAFLEVDHPETFSRLWQCIGDAMLEIWDRFLATYSETFCVCRIGDDLGFKTSLLVRPETIREHILPQYKRIVNLVHSYRRPFLLHSCGAIWDVMDDLIDYCKIDAKHSNEDAIAPFSRWVDLYGDRIGNFGGIDMNVLCTEDEKGIHEYVHDVLGHVAGYPGVAIGSGNQIADYVPPEAFLAMVETVREFTAQRG